MGVAVGIFTLGGLELEISLGSGRTPPLGAKCRQKRLGAPRVKKEIRRRGGPPPEPGAPCHGITGIQVNPALRING